MNHLARDLFKNPTAQKFLIAAIGILFILLFLKFVKKSLFSRVRSEKWYMTRKSINIIGYILVLFLLGIVFNDRLGGLTVTLGFASAGIAFALREVITSFAGWIGILFGGFYKTGDRVQLGGIKGDVIDIGVLRTTLMELGEWVDGDLYNGRIVRIANSFVFSEPVFNYSADFPFLWDELTIPIRYGSDYEKTRTILENAANKIVGNYKEEALIEWKKMVKKYILENQSLDSKVSVETNDNWVEFTLRYVVDLKKRRATKNDLYMEILNQIDQTDGTIEYASTTIELVR